MKNKWNRWQFINLYTPEIKSIDCMLERKREKKSHISTENGVDFNIKGLEDNTKQKNE